MSFASDDAAARHWNKGRHEWDDEYRRLNKVINEKDEEIKRLMVELDRLRAMTQAFR